MAQEETEATRAENSASADPGPESRRREATSKGQARRVTVALGRGPAWRAAIRATEGGWEGQGKAERGPTLDTQPPPGLGHGRHPGPKAAGLQLTFSSKVKATREGYSPSAMTTPARPSLRT